MLLFHQCNSWKFKDVIKSTSSTLPPATVAGQHSSWAQGSQSMLQQSSSTVHSLHKKRVAAIVLRSYVIVLLYYHYILAAALSAAALWILHSCFCGWSFWITGITVLHQAWCATDVNCIRVLLLIGRHSESWHLSQKNIILESYFHMISYYQLL